MKVKDLIKILQKKNQEMEVFMHTPSWFFKIPIEKNEIFNVILDDTDSLPGEDNNKEGCRECIVFGLRG